MNGAADVDEHWGAINGATSLPGTLKQPFFNVFFQLDDSKFLHAKWLFHQTSISSWLFGVPGLH